LALWLLCRHVNKKKLIAFLLGPAKIANIKYIIIIIFVILLLACLLVCLFACLLSRSLARETDFVSTFSAFSAV